MATAPQTYANHTRWHPPFHFFLSPIMLINVIWAIVQFVKNPGWNQGWWIVVSVALVMMAFLVRINPLRTQDRIIRLEEQLRYQQLLHADHAGQTKTLTVGQIAALRFASYVELQELVRAVLDVKLSRTADINQAINRCRGDSLRV